MEKEFEYKEEYGWLTNICLNVTDACNLACRYCFVEQHPHYMTLDVAKQAVYFILDNLEKKNKKFNRNDKSILTYFGGEPTIMWDEIIVPLTNWIKENDFPINLHITTNGTLLNEDRIQFLHTNNIVPLLSIDGNEKTQNFNRPCQNNNLNCFELVKTNIPLILKYFPDTTFRATIYSKTVENTFENYLFAISQGFKNIFFTPDIRNEWNEQEANQLVKEIQKIFGFYEFCFENY
jgi:sulfatase maturation enzyme AslB (radical SAM superfamily)